MTAALLVLALAGVDIVGWSVHRIVAPRLRFAASTWASLAFLIAVGAVAVWFGLGWPWIIAIVLAGVTWAPMTSTWPTITLAYIALVAIAVVTAPRSASFGWFGGVAVDPATLVAAIAVALFLGLAANLICRAALEDARRRETSERPRPDRRLRSVLERRWAPPPRRDGELRGGRLIGPLERWLIVALALVGAQGIVAALMAAKGIVRFPEISKNSGEGSKAEEFLVGSLVSWGLAGAGALLIWTAR